MKPQRIDQRIFTSSHAHGQKSDAKISKWEMLLIRIKNSTCVLVCKRCVDSIMHIGQRCKALREYLTATYNQKDERKRADKLKDAIDKFVQKTGKIVRNKNDRIIKFQKLKEQYPKLRKTIEQRIRYEEEKSKRELILINKILEPLLAERWKAALASTQEKAEKTRQEKVEKIEKIRKKNAAVKIQRAFCRFQQNIKQAQERAENQGERFIRMEYPGTYKDKNDKGERKGRSWQNTEFYFDTQKKEKHLYTREPATQSPDKQGGSKHVVSEDERYVTLDKNRDSKKKFIYRDNDDIQDFPGLAYGVTVRPNKMIVRQAGEELWQQIANGKIYPLKAFEQIWLG